MDLAPRGALLLLAVLAWPAAAQNAATLIARAQQLEHGEGVPRDAAAAAALYCQAARLGAPQAQYALGWMYANGRGVAHDEGAAWRLFSLAAEQAEPAAQRALQWLAPAPDADLPACMAPDPALQLEGEAAAPAYGAASAPVRVLVERLAPGYGIDPEFALAIIAVESAFQVQAESPRQAQGLMQLIPATAQRFHVRDSFNAEQNIRGGLAYLRWLLAEFRGQVPLVLAAYNAGEQAVARYGGVPPFAETRAYVDRVGQLYRRDYHPVPPQP